VLLKNHVLMTGKLHEDDRKGATMRLKISAAKCIDCKLQICPGQSVPQLIINNIGSCILGNWRGDLLWTIIFEVLPAIMGKRESDTLTAPSLK
jgi:hypothetical protein